MKKIVLFVLIIFSSTVLQAQQLLTKDQQEVQKTVAEFFEALSNRDSIALKKYSTPDITLYEYGQIWTLDTLIRKAIKTNMSVDFKRTNTFDFITITIDKTMAWATYRLNSIVFKDGKQVTVEWLETVTLINEKKRWKLKHLHSTLIKRN